MQDRYYLNNMSDAEITIPLSAKRVIKPHTSLPLNNKDVAIFKEMKSKRKDRISRFDALRLSKIPLDRDSNHAKAKPAEAKEEKVETKAVETEVKTVEVKKEETAKEEKAVKTEAKEDKKEETAKEEKAAKTEANEDKKEASTKDKEEEAARKALEAKVNEQFI